MIFKEINKREKKSTFKITKLKVAEKLKLFFFSLNGNNNFYMSSFFFWRFELGSVGILGSSKTNKKIEKIFSIVPDRQAHRFRPNILQGLGAER